MINMGVDVWGAGFAGLVITYGLSLNLSVVFSVQNQCNLANIIISVERISQYMHLPSEAPAVIDDKRPPVQWPNTGKVELQNLQVTTPPYSILVNIQYYNNLKTE